MLYFFKKIKKNIWRYHDFPPVYQKSWWYDLQFLRYRGWQTEIGNYGPFFALLLPHLKTPKLRILKKMKKKLLKTSTSDTCSKKHNCMRYGYWDMEWDRQKFLSFCVIFCPFTLQTTRKIKVLNKIKKTSGDIIILHTSNKTHIHMMYGSWDIRHDGEFFIIMGHFLPFDPPNNKKSKFWKIKKKHLEVLSFYSCVPQMTIIWCMIPEIWSATDRIFCNFGPVVALLPH